MRRIFILVFYIALTGSLVFGMCVAWKDRMRPPIALSQAVDLAEKALGADAKTFYCIRAIVAETGGKGGDWTLEYSSQEGVHRWVIVGMDGKVSILKGAPVY